MAAPNTGLFVPSTYTWNLAQLNDVDIKPELKELLIQLYQNINQITLALNLKDSGYYDTQEFVNGQKFFPNPTQISSPSSSPSYRQDYRLLVNFGALPNNTTKSVPHGLTINSAFSFTRIYGCSSNQTGINYIPLPYASGTLANNIELSVSATNVTVTTSADWSAWTVTYIILEYLKF